MLARKGWSVMTKQEFFAQYGEVALKFSSYYKYEFYFEGVAPDGTLIVTRYGDGDSSTIYRFSVDAINEVWRVSGALQWYSIYAKKDGESIFVFETY
jgi:hypothetical protein